MVERGPLIFSISHTVWISLISLFFDYFSLSISLSLFLYLPSVSRFIDNIIAMDDGHSVLYILKAFNRGYSRMIGS